MNDFNEFTPSPAPEKSTGSVISHAWENYKTVVLFGIVLMVITAVASSLLGSLLQFALGISDDPELMNEAIRTKNYELLLDSPAFISKSSLSFITNLLLLPMYAGFIYMVHKANSQQEATFSDLFIGYKQNTAQIILYGFLSQILISIGLLFCVIPGILLASVLFIGLPIVFFENKTAVQALQKSFEIGKANWGTLLGITIVAYLIGISGVLLCCIGILASLPFIYAAMYSAYCAYVGTPTEIK